MNTFRVSRVMMPVVLGSAAYIVSEQRQQKMPFKTMMAPTAHCGFFDFLGFSNPVEGMSYHPHI